MNAPEDNSGNETDVFAGLSRTRPQRPSARRQQAKKPAPKPSGPAKATTAKAAAPKPAPARKPRVPKAAAIPPVPRSGYATPEDTAPADNDVISGAVQALAELAQLGASAGNSVLRSLLGRLPKP